MWVTAAMTPGSCVKMEGMADCATRKAPPSATPGAKPSTRMRISTYRAVDRSFCSNPRRCIAVSELKTELVHDVHQNVPRRQQVLLRYPGER